jgi:hypothetical protein
MSLTSGCHSGETNPQSIVETLLVAHHAQVDFNTGFLDVWDAPPTSPTPFSTWQSPWSRLPMIESGHRRA